MFRAIHRALVVLFWVLLLVGAWYLFERRDWFRPVIDEVEILRDLQLNSDPARVLGQWRGEVVKVTGPDSFKFKSPGGVTFHLRLEAAQAPVERTLEAQRYRDEGAVYLSRLILSNRVEVDLTYTNEYRLGLGMVFRGGTNINLEMVRVGLARIKPEQLKTLPVKVQHDFLAAQMQAQEAKIGMWK